MLTEEQVGKEIERLDTLVETYSGQLRKAAQTSSTITIMGICDSINIANAWIDAFEFVLEERERGFGPVAFV